MEKKEEYTYSLETSGIWTVVAKWKWALVVITVITIVTSFIFSGPSFIKPKYKSTVILFPTITNSVSSAILNEDAGRQVDILEFGKEDEAEQMLQILNSDDIRERIISKYKLMEHYRIDRGAAYPYTLLQKEFESNVSFERTEYMSVKIDVLDTDPDTAAAIANDISDLLDSIKTKIQHRSAAEALSIVEKEYRDKLVAVQLIEDSLKELRQIGVFDYTAQVTALTEEYAKSTSTFDEEKAKLPVYEKFLAPGDTLVIRTKAKITGSAAAVKNTEARLNTLANYGGSYHALSEMLWQERGQLALLKRKYERAKVDAEKSLPHKFVVNRAVRAEKKSYPVRWLIVLISTFSVFLLSMLIILVLENFNKAKTPL